MNFTTFFYKGRSIDTINMPTKNKNYERRKITTHTCVRMGEIRSDSHE